MTADGVPAELKNGVLTCLEDTELTLKASLPDNADSPKAVMAEYADSNGTKQLFYDEMSGTTAYTYNLGKISDDISIKLSIVEQCKVSLQTKGEQGRYINSTIQTDIGDVSLTFVEGSEDALRNADLFIPKVYELGFSIKNASDGTPLVSAGGTTLTGHTIETSYEGRIMHYRLPVTEDTVVTMKVLPAELTVETQGDIDFDVYDYYDEKLDKTEDNRICYYYWGTMTLKIKPEDNKAYEVEYFYEDVLEGSESSQLLYLERDEAGSCGERWQRQGRQRAKGSSRAGIQWECAYEKGLPFCPKRRFP